MDDERESDGDGPPCPICGKPSRRASRPFCSKRCADVDLGRWLNGVYRVPGAPAAADGPEPEEE
jgi:hypothetical protein